jgi:alpha-methylacyl-CoA racemase
MGGPLAGLRVVEVGGIGPVPFAGMILADMGADVVRIDRPGGIDTGSHRILLRGRRSLVLNLREERAREVVLDLAASSDALLEGFRPGVMERLGLGPEELLARQPRLVYGRMTGWGQDGPLARAAGHDINYIAVAGALEPLAGTDLAPTPPHNMLGDFGGGGMLLVCGVLAAVLHARKSGVGQVVDAAIVDGTALLTSMLHSMRAQGDWPGPRGENLFDGGAPFYRVYETADGGWLAVGAIEPQFYAQLLEGLGLADELAHIPQDDRSAWPRLRDTFATRIRERRRAEWLAAFEGTDACVSPAMAPDELATHPHLAHRGTYLEHDGMLQPAPAPRFGATPLDLPAPAPAPGADSPDLLRALGLAPDEIDELIDAGVVGVQTRHPN